MALIIGSTALNYHFPGYREPKDLDYFTLPGATQLMEGNGKPVEPYFSYEFLRYWDERELDGVTENMADLDELYTIKHSHAYWDLPNRSWSKHMADMIFLKKNGAKLIDELHDILYKVWEKQHGKKVVNLNMEADSFFTDAVDRIYDHDSIHDSVAYGDRAMYEQLLVPGKSVAIDSKKMWAMSHEDLVKLFREEVAATALERIVIPRNYKCSPGMAWNWSLRRTITSLTKGRSAKFIVSNFEEFMKPDDYVKRHLKNSNKLIKLA